MEESTGIKSVLFVTLCYSYHDLEFYFKITLVINVRGGRSRCGLIGIINWYCSHTE